MSADLHGKAVAWLPLADAGLELVKNRMCSWPVVHDEYSDGIVQNISWVARQLCHQTLERRRQVVCVTVARHSGNAND